VKKQKLLETFALVGLSVHVSEPT